MSDHNLQGKADSYQSFNGSDNSFTHRSVAFKRGLSDFPDSSDGFCHKKEMNRYKQTTQQLSTIFESQDMKIKALEDELKILSSAKEEYEKRSKTTEDKLRQQIEDKQNMIDSMKSFIEVNKSLREENSALNQKIKENDIALQGMGDSLQTIEQLRAENAAKTLRANEYKEKYEKLKTERDSDSKKLKSENTKYKKEITSLKSQRLYFQNNNENNKLKAVAKTQTQIRQKEIYGEAYKKLGYNNFHTIENICEKIVNSVKQIEQDQISETVEKMTNITDNLKDEQDTIEEQEMIILEKRSDGRVACGQCGQLFFTAGDLTRHMTVKHRTTDRSKNREDIQIVTIDDN